MSDEHEEEKKSPGLTNWFWAGLILSVAILIGWGFADSVGGKKSTSGRYEQTLAERNAQLERELEAAKVKQPAACQAPEAQLPSRMPAEQVRVVVDNTIYLTLAGQRQTKLPLSAVEWSQPVSIPSTALGVAPVNVNFEIMPAVGFKARVLDDLTPPGMPYREVSVPRDGSLPVAGLRRIEFKAMTAGQQAVVRISD